MLRGEDVRKVMEQILPESEIEEFARNLGVVERERKLDIGSFVRAMVITAGTPDGGAQADVFRTYLQSEVEEVNRSAFYKWFDPELEKLMERLSHRALEVANTMEMDLPHPLKIAKDWHIVDSSTVKLSDELIDEYPGTGKYAALKVHKKYSVGQGVMVHYHFSPAKEHDSKHLAIDESWEGRGLLADLGYASIKRIRECVKHNVWFVIRLKLNWKPKVTKIRRGEVNRTFAPGADFDMLLSKGTLRLNGKAIDAEVEVGEGEEKVSLRLVGVPSPKGLYCFFLTNLPPRIGPLQVGGIYRVRWEVELSFKLDKSVNRLDESDAKRAHVIRAMLHASLISSIIASVLTHIHNKRIRRRRGKGQRSSAPLHVMLVAKMLASMSLPIADAFSLEGKASDKEWDRIARKIVHAGRDPNWLSRPSVLDKLRGWKVQSPRTKKAAKNKARSA